MHLDGLFVHQVVEWLCWWNLLVWTVVPLKAKFFRLYKKKLPSLITSPRKMHLQNMKQIRVWVLKIKKIWNFGPEGFFSFVSSVNKQYISKAIIFEMVVGKKFDSFVESETFNCDPLVSSLTPARQLSQSKYSGEVNLAKLPSVMTLDYSGKYFLKFEW